MILYSLRPGQRRVSRGGIGAFRGRDVRQLTLSGIRSRGGIQVRVSRDNENDRELEHDSGDEDYAKPSVQSSVIATPKEPRTREDLIKEQSKDTNSTARNKRMFGLLMGTLTSFKRQATAVSDRDVQRQAIEKKLEDRAVKERENLKKERLNLFSKRRQQQIRLKRIEHKMELVKIHEEWEQQTNLLMKFIRTRCKPPIFWLPKISNEDTDKKIDETNAVLQEIIEDRRKQLAEEIEEVMHGEMNNDDIAALDDLETSKNSDQSLVVEENFDSSAGKFNHTEEGEIVDERHHENKENEASLFRHRSDGNKRHYRSRADNDDDDDESKSKKHKTHTVDKNENEKHSDNRHKSSRLHHKSRGHRHGSKSRRRHSSGKQHSEHGRSERKHSKSRKVDKSQEKSKARRSSSFSKTASLVLNNEPEIISSKNDDENNIADDIEPETSLLESNLNEKPPPIENAMQKLSTDYPDVLPEPVLVDNETKNMSEKVITEETCDLMNSENSISLDVSMSFKEDLKESDHSKESVNSKEVESDDTKNISESILLHNISEANLQEPSDEPIISKSEFDDSPNHVDILNEKEIRIDEGSSINEDLVSKKVHTDSSKNRDVKKKSNKNKDLHETVDYEPRKKRSKSDDSINDNDKKVVHEIEKTVVDKYSMQSSRNVKITSVSKAYDDIIFDGSLIEPKLEIKAEPTDDDFEIKRERTSEEREIEKPKWKEIAVSENKRFVARVVKEKTKSVRPMQVKSVNSNKMKHTDNRFFVMNPSDASLIDDDIDEKKYSCEMKEIAEEASRTVIMKDSTNVVHEEHSEKNEDADPTPILKNIDSIEVDMSSSRVVIQTDPTASNSNQSETCDYSHNSPSGLSSPQEKPGFDNSKNQFIETHQDPPIDSKSENVKQDEGKSKSVSESSSDSDSNSSQSSSSSDSESESDTEQKSNLSSSYNRQRSIKTKKRKNSSSSSSSEDETQSNISAHSDLKKMKHKSKNDSKIPEITMSSNNELVIGDLRMVISDVPLPPPKDT